MPEDNPSIIPLALDSQMDKHYDYEVCSDQREVERMTLEMEVVRSTHTSNPKQLNKFRILISAVACALDLKSSALNNPAQG